MDPDELLLIAVDAYTDDYPAMAAAYLFAARLLEQKRKKKTLDQEIIEELREWIKEHISSQDKVPQICVQCWQPFYTPLQCGGGNPRDKVTTCSCSEVSNNGTT